MNLISKTVLLGGSSVVLYGLVSFYFSKPNPKEKPSPRVEPQLRDDLSEIKDVEIKEDKNVKTQDRKKFTSVFESNSRVLFAQKKINESLRYLDKSRRKQEFRDSGLDTYLDYKNSVSRLRDPYLEGLDRDSLKKRVISLRFLELSQHLLFEDCREILEDLSSQLKEVKDRQLVSNLRLDLYEVAQICAGEDPEATSMIADFEELEDAKEVIQMGVEYVSNL